MGPHLFVLAPPVFGSLALPHLSLSPVCVSPLLGSPVLVSLVLGSRVLGFPVLVTSTCVTLGLLASAVTLRPYLLFWGRRRNQCMLFYDLATIS